jgi:hypothetical protein
MQGSRKINQIDRWTALPPFADSFRDFLRMASHLCKSKDIDKCPGPLSVPAIKIGFDQSQGEIERSVSAIALTEPFSSLNG